VEHLVTATGPESDAVENTHAQAMARLFANTSGMEQRLLTALEQSVDVARGLRADNARLLAKVAELESRLDMSHVTDYSAPSI
jgi:hypothetical protein